MTTYLPRPDVVSLDGQWSFALRDRPEHVLVADVHGPTDGWSRVEVPGCWTMQGFGAPQYTNVQMPFPGPPPSVPDDNPTGVYRRTVTVPRAWRGRRIVLHVAGAESVLYVHVGGVPVGMGKDSRLPHEFDLTGIAEPGETDRDRAHGRALVGRDLPRRPGSLVSLRSAPQRVPVRDSAGVPRRRARRRRLRPDTGDGRLSVRAVVGTQGPPPKRWRARIAIAGQRAEGEVYFEHPNWVVNFLRFEGRGASASLTVPGVAPWTAETPNLHELTVTLRRRRRSRDRRRVARRRVSPGRGARATSCS